MQSKDCIHSENTAKGIHMSLGSPTRSLEIVEVSPRDGIQNLPEVLATEVKVELIRRALQTQVKRIEVTSFVHPARVPQMADAEAVVAAVRDLAGDARLSGLVLNRRGAERAIASGLDEITFVVLASETFNQRNQGASRAASMQAWSEIAALCQLAGVRTTFMIGAAFGCPFEGEVKASEVLRLLTQGLQAAPDEIALADTIGCAVPGQVSELFSLIAHQTDVPTRVHLHNTRNTGYANAFAAIAAGVTALDASLGGLGGCPFAPAATGNIATEDLAWMLGRSEMAALGALPAMIEAVDWMKSLGLPIDSLLPKAGSFPLN